MAKTTFRDKCIHAFTAQRKRAVYLMGRMPPAGGDIARELIAVYDRLIPACADLPDNPVKAGKPAGFSVGQRVRIREKHRPTYDFLLTPEELSGGALVVAAVSPDGNTVHVRTVAGTLMFVAKRFLEAA